MIDLFPLYLASGEGFEKQQGYIFMVRILPYIWDRMWEMIKHLHERQLSITGSFMFAGNKRPKTFVQYSAEKHYERLQSRASRACAISVGARLGSGSCCRQQLASLISYYRSPHCMSEQCFIGCGAEEPPTLCTCSERQLCGRHRVCSGWPARLTSLNSSNVLYCSLLT